MRPPATSQRAPLNGGINQSQFDQCPIAAISHTLRRSTNKTLVQRSLLRAAVRVRLGGLRGFLGHPAAAERAVEPHPRQQLVALRLRQLQLRVEKLALGVEDLEIARHAAAIADVGEPGRVAQRDDERFLLDAKLAALAVLDERVRDVAEGLLDRLPVTLERF